MLYVEILMLITGVWAIATGKIPSLLFGGPQYKLEGRSARLLGVLLLLPILITFVGSSFLEDVFGLELITVLGFGIAAIVISRLIRQPREE